MDPITAAIIAAVATGLGKTTQTAIADAYQGLKRLLAHHFGENSDVVKAVNTLEEKPDSPARREMVGEEIGATDSTSRPDILAAAQELLTRVKEAAGEASSVTAVSSGITAGGNVTQTAGGDAAGRDITKNDR